MRQILHYITCASLRWKTKVTMSNHFYLVVVALLPSFCKKINWRPSHRQVSRSTPFPESAFFSFLISALGKEGKKRVTAQLSYILMICLKTQHCTDTLLNFSCCIAQTRKQVKVSVLHDAEDISQHFSDEVGRELKIYRQTSQPACRQR